MSTLAESAYRDARIISLQAQLLDHTGHVRRGMSRDDRRIILDEITRLRALNGWPPLNMTGRTRRQPTCVVCGGRTSHATRL